MNSSLIRTPGGWRTHDRGAFTLHVDPTHEEIEAFALSIAAGLDDHPRWLDSRYLYDAAGSALFERITEQPEYYQTRTEERLLAAHARTIRGLVGGAAVVELGSGSSAKTRHLLNAWTESGPTRYWPIDVSATALEQACADLAAAYPRLAVEGVAASYERALPVVAGTAPMMLVFLGSSLGNLGKHGQREFLELVAAHLAPDDTFLIGLDFAKAAPPLEAAYDDAAGVTAAFTRNLFARMNRELGSEIPLDDVKHVAYYNVEHERVEIYAEFAREVALRLGPIDRVFRIARGERIRTELAYKYRPEAATAAIERHGFQLAWQTSDQQHGFGLFLFRRLPTTAASRPSQLPAWQALLDRTRARTREIVTPLGDGDLTRQHSPLMSPLLWDLGHIANFEEMWLLRKLEGGSPGEPRDARDEARAASRLDALYDPLATPRAGREQLVLPSPDDTHAYMDDVRRRAVGQLQRLDTGLVRGPLAHEGHVVHLVAQHEAQHQETMLQAIALRDDLLYRPAFAVEMASAPAVSPAGSVLIPAGPFIMGTSDRVWAYDNERPAHEVQLPAFRLDVAPVTNRQYLAFMEDGGYRRRELWTEEGWAWRQRTDAVGPLHWRARPQPGNGQPWEAISFGRRAPVDPDCPVLHVSWYEADAWARWAGKRLPTEAEWEKAAAWDVGRQAARRYPWGDAADGAGVRANLGQQHLQPAAVGTLPRGRSPYGCLQMLGDVWEWTQTWFHGYPGFRSFPYREYSETFFGQTYRVLRGGSFATDRIVARNTFRNWDFPERRQIFAGFRCAADV
jgi:iron(II)-dependent oxidoreductase